MSLGLELALTISADEGEVAARAPGVQSPFSVTISPADSSTVGQVLTAELHGDLGNPAGDVTFVWKLDGVAIGGGGGDLEGLLTFPLGLETAGGEATETGQTYVADTVGDVTVVATITNASGNTSDESPVVVVTEELQAPFNRETPAFSGTLTVGQVQTVTENGDWGGNPPPDVVITWQRDGTDIPGETGNTYTLQAADAGHLIRFRSGATNSVEYIEAYSAEVLVSTAAEAPTVSLAPAISGSREIGGDLIANHTGVYTGSPAPDLVLQWQRNEVDLSGETTEIYTLVPLDEGEDIRLAVTATNTAGSVTAYSNVLVSSSARLIATQYLGESFSGYFDNAYSGVQVGDLIVGWGFVHNSLTIPSEPAGFTTPAGGTSSANTSAGRISYKIATSADLDAIWNFAGASRSVMAVIRDFNPADIFGSVLAFTTSLDTTPNWSALTSVGKGLMLAFRGLRGSVTPVSVYPGMEIVAYQGGADASIQASVTAADGPIGAIPASLVGPFTTIPLGDLSSYEEPVLSGSSAGAHTALLKINAAVLTTLFAPVSLVLPEVSGIPTEGQLLTAENDGSWAGNPTPDLARNWQRDAVDIPGETATTYLLAAADVGHTVSFEVTASNTQGTVTASSDGLFIAALVQPPVNSVLPSMSGTFTVGNTVNRVVGTWSGSPGFATRWLREGAAISGETGASYLLAAADANKSLSVEITATNAGGFSIAVSSSVVVSPAAQAPTVTGNPAIAGPGTIGQVLTRTSTGTATGTPTPTVSGQNWQRNGVDIAGETGNSHTLVAADGGQNIRLRVRWNNTQGDADGFSTAIAVTAATAPVNTGQPQVSGDPTVGLQISVSDGVWTGTEPISKAKQWQRNGNNIAGQTNSNYTVQTADVDQQIRARVTGSNIAGSLAVFSPAVIGRASSDNFENRVVTVANHLSVLPQSRIRNTRYLFSPGVYPEFYWPNNVNDFQVEVVPLDRNNPPTIRGIGLGKLGNPTKTNFAYISGTPGGSIFRRMKFDGLSFIAERFTQGRDSGGTLHSFITGAGAMPDAATEGGIGWRVCGTSHPSGNLVGFSENGAYQALMLLAGDDIEVCNCLFDGYQIQLEVGTPNVEVHHNTFQKCPEDFVKFDSDGFWFHDNEIGYTRVVSDQIAGWLGGPVPPHPDGIQQMAPANDMRIIDNVFNNIISGRADQLMHGGLIRNARATGKSRRVTFTGNELRTIDDTGFLISDIENDGGGGINGSNLDFDIRGNKIWSGGRPFDNNGPVFGFVDYNPSVIGSRGRFENNVSPRINNGGGTYPDNTQSNAAGTLPTGWRAKARDRVGAGVPFSGRYGATAGVIP